MTAAPRTSIPFAEHLAVARELVGDQQVLSQGRCVDLLLDLYNEAPAAARAPIESLLGSIRRQTAVVGDDVRALLDELSVEVEMAALFDDAEAVAGA
ncbi:MAG: hypothetical protein OEY23_02580 [Acidimicrobiia bacterium]|nr:hypothetical protein [Acidimicrobiia bacterium]